MQNHYASGNHTTVWIWKSKMAKQAISDSTVDSVSLSVLPLRELLNLKHSSKICFCPSGLGSFSLLCPQPIQGCGYTFKQTVGAAPSLLSQLTSLQKRIYLFSFFVQTRGQRAWQLVANHRVCWSLPEKEKRTPSPGQPLQLPQKKLTNKYLPEGCKKFTPTPLSWAATISQKAG